MAGRPPAGSRWTSASGGQLSRSSSPVAVVDVVVGAVETDVGVARSGPRTTSTSAVPMELTGAAVVYGATDVGARWRSAATAAADGSCPAT